jgi:hypothetical protein
LINTLVLFVSWMSLVPRSQLSLYHHFGAARTHTLKTPYFLHHLRILNLQEIKSCYSLLTWYQNSPKMQATTASIPIRSFSEADTSFILTFLHEIDHAPWKLMLWAWTLAFAVLPLLLVLFWIAVAIKSRVVLWYFLDLHLNGSSQYFLELYLDGLNVKSDSKARASPKSSSGFDFASLFNHFITSKFCSDFLLVFNEFLLCSSYW